MCEPTTSTPTGASCTWSGTTPPVRATGEISRTNVGRARLEVVDLESVLVDRPGSAGGGNLDEMQADNGPATVEGCFVARRIAAEQRRGASRNRRLQIPHGAGAHPQLDPTRRRWVGREDAEVALDPDQGAGLPGRRVDRDRLAEGPVQRRCIGVDECRGDGVARPAPRVEAHVIGAARDGERITLHRDATSEPEAIGRRPRRIRPHGGDRSERPGDPRTGQRDRHHDDGSVDRATRGAGVTDDQLGVGHVEVDQPCRVVAPRHGRAERPGVGDGVQLVQVDGSQVGKGVVVVDGHHVVAHRQARDARPERDGL